MKKKIALFLAGAMALSSVPTIGLFASSSNSVTNRFTNLPVKTLIVQDMSFSSGTVDGGDADVEYVSRGVQWRAEMDSEDDLSNYLGYADNDQFTLTLSNNAEWFFAKDEAAAGAVGNPIYDATNTDIGNANASARTATFDEFTGVENTLGEDFSNLLQAFEEAEEAAEAAIDADADAASEADDLAAVQALYQELLDDYIDAVVSSNADITTYVNLVDARAQAAVGGGVTDFESLDSALGGAVAPTETEREKALDASLAILGGAITFVPTSDSDFIDDEGDYKVYRKLEAYIGNDHYFDIEIDEYAKENATITMNVIIPPEAIFNIPIIARTTDDGGNVTIEADGSTLSNETETINTESTASGTKIKIESVKQDRNRVNLDTIVIEETSSGVIKSGLTRFTIEDGYEWVLTSDFELSTTRMTINGKPSVAANGDLTRLWLNEDKNELTMRFDNVLPRAGNLKGIIYIDGLAIQPNEDTEDDGYFGTTITMDVEEVDNYPVEVDDEWEDQAGPKSGIKEANNITVAKFEDYGLSLEFDNESSKATEAFSGTLEIDGGKESDDDLAEIKFSENTAKSWFVPRGVDFTLTDAEGKELGDDKVKFFSFEIVETTDVAINDTSVIDYANKSTSQVDFDRDKVTVTGTANIADGKLGEMLVKVVISAAADFTGDVYLNVAGSGTTNNNVQPLKIATVTAPITVETKTTNVAIGYQTYAVADITVTENKAGALNEDETLDISVREFASWTRDSASDVEFNPLRAENFEMISGDIDIDEIDLIGENTITIEISNESKTASSFKLTGLAIKADHSVPYGSYDLVIGGKAWVENLFDNDDKGADDDDAKFDAEGLVVENYVRVATPGEDMSISKNIVVVANTANAIVDGVDVTMSVATYIDPATNRTMLPLRAVSELFGIDPETGVLWDSKNGIATIFVSESKIVTFSDRSTQMTINGLPIEMEDENGISVSGTINPENDRMYLPLRQLGIAFGIDVLWIESAGQAVFNPTPAQYEAAAAPAADDTVTDDTVTDDTVTDDTVTDDTVTE